jgi:chitinase
MENELSMTYKGAYIIENQLGGAYVFSIDSDDFSGSFCSQGKFPLTKTIINIFKRAKINFL